MSDQFGALDYVVLVFMLMISTIIGLYYAWKDRNNTDEDEFLRGGKHMTVLPVCISILASFLPSTSFIGFPTVVYATGTQFWVGIIPATLAAILACEVFIPVYYNMNLVSVNEYLHKRFKSHNLQIIANISTLLAMIPFFGVELFAPSIALSIVTDMSITSSILTIGVIVTLYTSLGGLKGVIWTDFFQFSVMVFGLVSVAVRGANINGGMAKAWEKAHTGGRIEFWNMDFDIYSVNSFWVYMIGFTILWSGTFSTSQLQIQRSVCMPTLKSAKKALYWATPGFIVIISMCVVLGVVMYARFYDCDPMLTGRVTRGDQLLPYFVLNIFEDDYPGFPGAFVACIFGSSLSTLSSGLNAMASIIWDDYAKKIFHFLPENYGVFATKLLAILIGILSISFAFVVKETDNIVDAAVMLYGASNGPMFALFCLGLFFPWANAWGGGSALIIGQILSLWITVGSVADKRDPMTMSLGLSTDACAAQNITVYMPGAPLSFLTTYKIPEYKPKGIDAIHHISPFFVPAIGFFTTLLVGNIVSLATKGNKDKVVDKDLVNLKVCSLMEKLLPKNWRVLDNETPVRHNRVPNPINRQTFGKPLDSMRNSDKFFNQTEDEEPEDQQSVQPLNSIDKTTNI